MKSRLMLLLVVLVVLISLAEIIIAITHYDVKTLWPALYFVEEPRWYSDDKQIYQHSDNPFRLYELNPGVEAYCKKCVHSKETAYDSTFIKVNELGFRDIARDSIKRPGTIRIIVFGGSNTYGASVSNQDTYPAQMQALLDSIKPGQYEVWNAGLSGYVMSQKVEYAEQVLKKYDPDLIIFQHSNIGRKPFYYYDDHYEELFEQNKELYNENLPFLLVHSNTVNAIHHRLLKISGFYRFVMASMNNIIVEKRLQGCTYDCFDEEIQQRYNMYGEMVNQRETKRFFEDHPDIPIIIFEPLNRMLCPPPESGYSNVSYIGLCDEGKMKPEEYYEIHPPSYVYEWYAKKLVPKVLSMNLK